MSTEQPSADQHCAPEHKKVNGQCRRCRKCLDCCGKAAVSGSCRHKELRMSPAALVRSARATEGYWNSVEAGRQKR